jgi:hypothetical protein
MIHSKCIGRKKLESGDPESVSSYMLCDKVVTYRSYYYLRSIRKSKDIPAIGPVCCGYLGGRITTRPLFTNMFFVNICAGGLLNL